MIHEFRGEIVIHAGWHVVKGWDLSWILTGQMERRKNTFLVPGTAHVGSSVCEKQVSGGQCSKWRITLGKNSSKWMIMIGWDSSRELKPYGL